MKKWISVLVLFAVVIAIGSCTNDEGGSDLDVITPSDTVESVNKARTL